MTNDKRPLSPHIGIYRWPITMALSIMHRASGIGLATALIAMVVWLLSIASGPQSYLYFERAMASFSGQGLLILWSMAFFYHLSNGVRHLVWDMGYGFEKAQANRSSVAVLVSAVALTAAFWLVLV